MALKYRARENVSMDTPHSAGTYMEVSMDTSQNHAPANPSPATIAHLEKAGWRIREWCRSVGIARSTYYALDESSAPRTVVIGRMVIIVEQPGEWLQRVSAAQRAAA